MVAEVAAHAAPPTASNNVAEEAVADEVAPNGEIEDIVIPGDIGEVVSEEKPAPAEEK